MGTHDKDWTYTWYDSTSPDGNAGTASGGTCYQVGHCDTEKFVQDVNANGLCGHSDWRMPSRRELPSIADYGRGNDSNDPAYFPSTSSSAAASAFWSGSPYAGDSSSAWYVDFGFGTVGEGLRTETLHVRFVRGGQAFGDWIFEDGFEDGG